MRGGFGLRRRVRFCGSSALSKILLFVWYLINYLRSTELLLLSMFFLHLSPGTRGDFMVGEWGVEYSSVGHGIAKTFAGDLDRAGTVYVFHDAAG